MAGLSAGLAAASAPNMPNASASSRRATMAQLRALPGQRMVDMAARLGTDVDYPTGQLRPTYETMSPADAYRRGFINNNQLNTALKSGRPTVRVVTGHAPQTRHADFEGYGDADTAGFLTRHAADLGLDIQKKYGADYVDAALAQQAQADPEGTAARKLLAGEINRIEDEREDRPRPVANALDAQMTEELQAGRGLTSDVQGVIQDVLARRNAQGTGGTVDMSGIEQELTTGLRGDARQAARVRKGIGYLSSGATPEDAEYKDRQQSFANMASFLAGRTPQSQFGANAGAQQGAAPVPQGTPAVNLPGNVNAVSQAAASNNYAQNVRQAATQVSPWFQGLNLVTRGVKAGAAAA